jgi:competence protein ComEC
MKTASVAFLLGNLSVAGLSALPDPMWLGLWPLSLILLWQRRLRPVAWFLMGFLYHAHAIERHLIQRIPVPMPSKGGETRPGGASEISVKAVVTELGSVRSNHARIVIQVLAVVSPSGHAIESDEHAVGRRIDVRWYGRVSVPEPGEVYVFTLRLRPPGYFANPGAHDEQRRMLIRNLHARATVKRARLVSDAVGTRLPISDRGAVALARLRYRAGRMIAGWFRTLEVAALAKALAVGDRGAIATHQWRVLRLTGTAHLLAISGLHVGLVAALGMGIGRALGAAMSSRREPYVWGCIGAILLALGYAMLAGLSHPTLRALVTVCVFTVAMSSRRMHTGANSLAISLFAVLLIDPHASLTMGMWLSFVAVACLLVFATFTTSRGRGGCEHGLARRVLTMQLFIVAAMAPLSLYLFDEQGLVAPLVNAVAVPVVTIVVVPMLLASMAIAYAASLCGLSELIDMITLIGPLELVLESLWGMLRHTAAWTPVVHRTDTAHPVLLLLFCAGVLGLTVLPDHTGRLASLLCGMPLVLALVGPPADPEPLSAVAITRVVTHKGQPLQVRTPRIVLVLSARSTTEYVAGLRALSPDDRNRSIVRLAPKGPRTWRAQRAIGTLARTCKERFVWREPGVRIVIRGESRGLGCRMQLTMQAGSIEASVRRGGSLVRFVESRRCASSDLASNNGLLHLGEGAGKLSVPLGGCGVTLESFHRKHRRPWHDPVATSP